MDNPTIIVVRFTGDCDIHICGVCKSQFYLLENFMRHKINECQLKDFEQSPFYTPLISEDEIFQKNRIDCDKSVIVRNEPVKIKRNHDREEQFQEHYLKYVKSKTTPFDREKKPNFKIKDVGNKKEDKIKMRFPCQQCSYSSLFKKDLDRHSMIHTGERPFKCSECGKTFTRNDKLLGHMRIHNNDKKFKCELCDYATVDSTCLTKHRRIHTGVKPYKCQLCEYRSRSQAQLVVHLRRHTGDAPYFCTHAFCNSSFRTTTDLKRHLSTHLSVKPFACEHCPYRTNLKCHLKNHLQKKHPNGEDGVTKMHTCSSCSATFPSAVKLRNHTRAKHKVATPNIPRRTKKVDGVRMAKMHHCKECNASFVSPANLEIHIAQHNKKKAVSAPTHENAKEPGIKFVEDERFSISPSSYLDCSQYDTNLRSAEMLASLAGDDVPSIRSFSAMSPDFFSIHDPASAHDML